MSRKNAKNTATDVFGNIQEEVIFGGKISHPEK